MGMREQAIEEVRIILHSQASPNALVIARAMAERALTAEVALAEARSLLERAMDQVDVLAPDLARELAAWLELHKEKGPTR